ncbi:22321_t:CDS:2 [Dentiscutata erythropus]|uniref:22321_t:CDS:1 n=1 Tax=Dentiscutata erythropus TaxID=1348616 RepID=A0A9N8V7V1_9GLOM|nr:22321_t:CDS:2 [Dentiscutata erythropus]
MINHDLQYTRMIKSYQTASKHHLVVGGGVTINKLKLIIIEMSPIAWSNNHYRTL